MKLILCCRFSTVQSDVVSDDGLLNGWVCSIINGFLQSLQQYLPLISDGLSLNNILDQSMYYGVSLGRVGVDFRVMISTIFERAIYNLFCDGVNSATTHFIENLRTMRLLSPPKQIFPAIGKLCDVMSVG
jgi:hypothetical protein